MKNMFFVRHKILRWKFDVYINYQPLHRIKKFFSIIFLVMLSILVSPLDVNSQLKTFWILEIRRWHETNILMSQNSAGFNPVKDIRGIFQLNITSCCSILFNPAWLHADFSDARLWAELV